MTGAVAVTVPLGAPALAALPAGPGRLTRACERRPSRPRRSAGWKPALPGTYQHHPLGISFSGSVKGLRTTTAELRATGVSTTTSVPSVACSIGSMAKPMFFLSRGE